MDCDDPADPQLCEPVIRVASGPNARVGWLPVSYNAAAKKLTWYMFLATPGGLKVCDSPDHSTRGMYEHFMQAKK